jgi:hypothetical protein
VTASRSASASLSHQSVDARRDGVAIRNSSRSASDTQSMSLGEDGLSTTRSRSAERSDQSLDATRRGINASGSSADLTVARTTGIGPDGMAVADTVSGGRSSQNMAMTRADIHVEASDQFAGAGQVQATMPDVGSVLAAMQALDEGSVVLSVRRNGNNLAFFHMLAEILDQARKLKEALIALFSAKIQVGFGFDVDVVFMEGSLKAIWGVLPKRAPDSNRIWRVDRYFGIDAKLTILSVTGKGSFGVEVEIGHTRWGAAISVIAEAYVSLSISASLEASLKTIPEQEHRFPAKVDSVLKLGVTGKAKLLGIGYDAEASVETGVEGKIELVLSMSDPFRIEGEVRLKPMEVNIKVTGPFLISYIRKYTWPEENQLWKRQFHWPQANGGATASWEPKAQAGASASWGPQSSTGVTESW